MDVWRNRLHESATALIACGVPSRKLAVETLQYPFECVTPVVGAFLGGLAYALDWGLRTSPGWNDPGLRAFVLVLLGKWAAFCLGAGPTRSHLVFNV